ncbi:hypothetical protein BC834DRAFT_474217 [Gloeopeniophorella convolvens]|nr:hypothetical protein BC834DRAFT_474217 [Gloeopeniophorella convolvens]
MATTRAQSRAWGQIMSGYMYGRRWFIDNLSDAPEIRPSHRTPASIMTGGSPLTPLVSLHLPSQHACGRNRWRASSISSVAYPVLFLVSGCASVQCLFWPARRLVSLQVGQQRPPAHEMRRRSGPRSPRPSVTFTASVYAQRSESMRPQRRAHTRLDADWTHNKYTSRALDAGTACRRCHLRAPDQLGPLLVRHKRMGTRAPIVTNNIFLRPG